MGNQVLKLRANDYNPDVTPSETSMDEWTTGSNVVFRSGQTQLAPGWQNRYSPIPANVMAIDNVQISGVNWWVYHGTNSSHVVQTTNHSIATPTTGHITTNEPDYYSVGTLNGVPFFNNRLETPSYWNGTAGDPFVPLPNFPASTVVRKLVAFKFHLFGFGTDEPGGEFPQKIIWSDAAAAGSVPGTWTAAADNQAGDVVIATGGSVFQTAEPLGDTLIIYKNTSMHGADYVGGNDIYAFRDISPNTGALTTRAVANLDSNRHIVVTDGDIVDFDGTNIRSIANRRVRDYLFGTLEESTFQRLFVVYWQAKQEVWICYPGTGATYCSEALIYDINNDKWSTPRTLYNVTCGRTGVVDDSASQTVWNDDSDVWDEDTSIWNQESFPLNTRDLVLGAVVNLGSPILVGSPVGVGSPPAEAGYFHQITGTTESDQLTTATIGKYRMDFGDPTTFKNVFALFPKVKAVAGQLTFQFRVGSSKTDTSDITWDSWRTFRVGVDDYVDVDLKEAGRFISIEGRTTEADPWTLMGIDIEFRVEGRY